MKDIGIYIHIPFCKSKCAYCDFCSFAGMENLIEQYIQCLIKELENKLTKEEYKVKTIYFGGGTPSYINEKYIGEIIAEIKNNSSLDNEIEITLEANPGTITQRKLEKYFEYGINRLSIGLQTSNNKILKSIGRIHKYKDFENAINMAKEVGFTNISSDIIIGLPGQTIYDVEESINKLVELNLNHISVYSLIMEEKTPLYISYENGEIELPDEELERYMYWYAKRRLEEAGFVHYEISNFAKPGYYAKHNLDCWSQKEYLGFGLSASSYENNTRYSNIKDLSKYIKNIESNNCKKNIIVEEKQDVEAQMKEYMMLGFRKILGVDITKFEKKFGVNPLVKYKDVLEKLLVEQLIEYSAEYLRLSKKGIDFANMVFKEFV